MFQAVGAAVGKIPVLTVWGSLDGVLRASEFALAHHVAQTPPRAEHRFAVIRGASHASFTNTANKIHSALVSTVAHRH